MNWPLAAAAPALLGGILWATGRPNLSIGAYHALCAVVIFRSRRRIRPLLAWGSGAGRWALGTSLAALVGLLVPVLVVGPATIRQYRAFFPWNSSEAAFTLFAAYTMLIHCPLEEIFWRGAVTDPNAPEARRIAGNAVFFYLLHGAAMACSLGAQGWGLAAPTALAGGAWAFVTGRSRSLWPALVSHWVVDAVILVGMWAFFVRR